MRTEITLNDSDGEPVLILSNFLEEDYLIVQICSKEVKVRVCIDELKAALRKLSAK